MRVGLLVPEMLLGKGFPRRLVIRPQVPPPIPRGNRGIFALVRLTDAGGPSGSNSFDQAVESKEVNPPAIVLADEGWAGIGGDDQ